MRLSLTQENLSKALGTVGRVVSGRSSLPVLANVLLTTDANRLRLSATNLEIGINYWIGSKVDEGGSITVPARLFSEFVSSLPGGNIDLESKELNLSVRTPHFESKINGISAEEFPLIPQIDGDPVLTISASEFRDALTRVVVAASLDEARPVLAGVYFYRDEDELVIVATDSYRLAEQRLALKENDTKIDVIVPARTMQELIRILGDSEGDLKVYVDDNQVMFQVDNVELVSRLIEGQFPNYQQIVPKSAETSFEIDTAEFSRITKVASLFARESAGSIKLEVKSDGEVSVVSSDSEVGGNKSSAECDVSGEDGEVSLNARYLSDALAVIKSDKVNFAITGKLSACVISPAGRGAEEGYIHIVMPLRT